MNELFSSINLKDLILFIATFSATFALMKFRIQKTEKDIIDIKKELAEFKRDIKNELETIYNKIEKMHNENIARQNAFESRFNKNEIDMATLKVNTAHIIDILKNKN